MPSFLFPPSYPSTASLQEQLDQMLQSHYGEALDAVSWQERWMRLNSMAMSWMLQQQQQQQDGQEVTGCTQDAIVLLRWLLQQVQAKMEHGPSRAQDSTHMLPPRAILTPASCAAVVLDPDMNTLTAKANQGFTFYPQVFVWQEPASTTPDDSTVVAAAAIKQEEEEEEDVHEWTLASISAVILYNLAVLLHARFMHRGRIHVMERVQRLYENALACLTMDPEDNAPCLCKAHLTMALYTNLGHVSILLQDSCTRTKCAQGLGDLLHRQQQQNNTVVEIDCFRLVDESQPFWMCFFWTVWSRVSHFAGFCVAAAAQDVIL